MLNNKTGYFISFEGIDGCGKTTQIRILKGKLIKKKIDNILITREPGGEKNAEKIRTIILQQKNIKLEKETELLLFLASRNEHVNKIIKPALKKKQLVISDRFSDSTYAYQCYKEKSISIFYNKVNKAFKDDILPNITFLLDIKPEVCMQRIAKRTNKNSFDKKNISFYRKVREGYIKLAKNNKRITIINAAEKSELISEQILNILEKKNLFKYVNK